MKIKPPLRQVFYGENNWLFFKKKVAKVIINLLTCLKKVLSEAEGKEKQF